MPASVIPKKPALIKKWVSFHVKAVSLIMAETYVRKVRSSLFFLHKLSEQLIYHIGFDSRNSSNTDNPLGNFLAAE